MFRHWLEENYGIKPEEEITIGNYSACKRGDQLYLLIHPVKADNDEISELQTMALHLAGNGDRTVPLFFPGKNGEILTQWKNEKACILISQKADMKRTARLGRSLGKFHHRGRSLRSPIKKGQQNWRMEGNMGKTAGSNGESLEW